MSTEIFFMTTQNRFDADLTVRSFAYVAKQLAQGAAAPSALYEQILAEAEKHRSALRMMRRDMVEKVETALRSRTLTKGEFQSLCDAAVQKIELAQQSITRIAMQYAPQRLAA
jgi:hypothetical protein